MKTIPITRFLITGSMLLFCSPWVRAQTFTSVHNKDILEARQGSIVQLPGFLTEKMPRIEYQKIVLPGPQYIISDDPEYIRVPETIALREAVQPGTVRLYVYNVNGVRDPVKMDRKITAVIKNTGTETMHIRMLKFSSQKPSTNYYQVGKQGLADFLASSPSAKVRKVKPGKAISIDENLEKNIVKYDELTHGFYEFVIDQPGEISVLQTDLKTPGAKALSRIKTVETSSHVNAGRGLFGISNYLVKSDEVLDTKNGAVALVVADGEKDRWVIGKDGSTGKLAKLSGNYGVMYHIELKWKSTNGKGLALLTWNSRSDSKWCGAMANAMEVSEGKFKGGVIQLPADQMVTKAAPEAVLIQLFPPAENGEEQTITLTYSPPGASCLPTPLVFIPVEMEARSDQ
jgi:hypothetical protein